MNHIASFEKRLGVDAGYHSSNIYPANGEGRVGKGGIDKNYTLVEIIELAYRIEERPNIIVKAGLDAKWYLKRFQKHELDEEIEKQSKFKDTSRCTMYIIEWD